MKFTRDWTEFARPSGESLWRPTIDLAVRGVEGWELHRFLVDSGADLSMAPYSLFRTLGKSWDDGERRVLRGISRRKVCMIEGRVHEVDILVVEVGVQFSIPMCFARADVPFLVGREGFFDHFLVTFDKLARRTVFEFVTAYT
jgi:hypothetical protein